MHSYRERTYVFVLIISCSLCLYETWYMHNTCWNNMHKSDLHLDSLPEEHGFSTNFNMKPEFDLPHAKALLFSGKMFREREKNVELENDLYFVDDNKKKCKKWAVVTTIFKPSESVRYIIKNPNWCIVVVADVQTQSPETYMSDLGYKGENLVFLEPSDHIRLYPAISKTLPWKHFGRKNIGYIYAIHHGAEYIWDFDDDNIGIIDVTEVNTMSNFSYLIPCSKLSKPMINPYPYFGVNETYSWPRGFPLEEIRNPSVTPTLCESRASVSIGVIQSLANNQPDVDAIYRFTRDNPFDFSATLADQRPLLIPTGAFTPFNAQATLWTKAAFLYLPLPISVDGRVTDIWRSYIAEYFFHRFNLQLFFAPPYVRQDRNPHNLLKDFDAENDLYMKSNVLINFLSDTLLNHDDLCLQDLYDELYKRGYIEFEDLNFIRAWVKTVEAIYTKVEDC